MAPSAKREPCNALGTPRRHSRFAAVPAGESCRADVSWSRAGAAHGRTLAPPAPRAALRSETVRCASGKSMVYDFISAFFNFTLDAPGDPFSRRLHSPRRADGSSIHTLRGELRLVRSRIQPGLERLGARPLQFALPTGQSSAIDGGPGAASQIEMGLRTGGRETGFWRAGRGLRTRLRQRR